MYIRIYITSNHLTALGAQKLRYPIFGIWKQLDWWWKCLTLGSHPTNHRIVISYRDVLDFRPMNMILLGDILGYHGDILGYTMMLLWCCKFYPLVGDWTTWSYWIPIFHPQWSPHSVPSKLSAVSRGLSRGVTSRGATQACRRWKSMGSVADMSLETLSGWWWLNHLEKY